MASVQMQIGATNFDVDSIFTRFGKRNLAKLRKVAPPSSQTPRKGSTPKRRRESEEEVESPFTPPTPKQAKTGTETFMPTPYVPLAGDRPLTLLELIVTAEQRKKDAEAAGNDLLMKILCIPSKLIGLDGGLTLLEDLLARDDDDDLLGCIAPVLKAALDPLKRCPEY